jgi:Zn ribbon nucleic-acid-binding protein
MAESTVDMYRMIDELSKITKQYTSRNYGRAITESVDGSKIDLLTGTKYDESKVSNLLIEQNNDVQMYLSLLIENYIGTRPVHENSITIQNYKCEECGRTSKEVEVRFPKDPDYDRVKRLHPDWNLSKGNLGYAICPNCKTKNDILIATESSVLTESAKDWVYHEQPIEDVTDDHIQKAYDYARHICEWCRMDSFAFVNINFCKAPIKLSNTSFVFGYLRDGCDQRTIDEIINTLNRNNSFDGGHYAAELQERDGRQAIILTITKLFYFEKIEDKGGE